MFRNRKKGFIPCDCEICFFCKESITNGIAHPNDVRGRGRGRPPKQIKCSVEWELLGEGRKCGSCYRKRKMEHPEETYQELRKRVKCKPRLGCIKCKETVCEACWPGYDHYPTTQKDKS